MSHVNLKDKTVLVTGAVGFIGSNLVKRLYEVGLQELITSF